MAANRSCHHFTRATLGLGWQAGAQALTLGARAEDDGAALQPSRPAPPDKLSDGELCSCEAGACGQAYHRRQRSLGQDATRHAKPEAPGRREGRRMECGAAQTRETVADHFRGRLWQPAGSSALPDRRCLIER